MPINQLNPLTSKTSALEPSLVQNALASASLLDPKVQIPNRTIKIQLAAQGMEEDCRFWVGLSKPGSLAVNPLLKSNTLEDFFTKAAGSGHLQNGPVLISNTDNGFAEYYYLLEPPKKDDINDFVLTITKTIYSVAANKVGFYFAPEILSKDLFDQILPLTLKHVILGSSCSSFYLMLGRHGLDCLLNISLSLKKDLLAHKINLTVLH